MVDIFVSYSKKDALHARTLSEYLESKGWDVFWDHEIPPGSNWVEYIGQNLDRSKLVVVLWSESSTESKWVRREASIALDKENLLPVRLQDVIPPNIFSSIQSASLLGWDGITKTPDLEKLLGIIEKKIGKPQSDATHVVERPITKPPTKPQVTPPEKKPEIKPEKNPEQASQQQIPKQQTQQPEIPVKKNTGLILALVGLAVLAIGGWFGFKHMQQQGTNELLQAERKYWTEIKDSDQPQVFQNYLSKYGSKPGTFTTDAREKYDSLIAAKDNAELLEKEMDYWDLVSTGDKIKGYKKYLKRYGEEPGTYTDQANTRIAELERAESDKLLLAAERDYWEAIKTTNNIEEVKAYLTKYGEVPGTFVTQANSKIETLNQQVSREELLVEEELFWKDIKDSGKPDNFQYYLDHYGADPGTFTSQAKEIIESIKIDLSRKEILKEEREVWAKIQNSTNQKDFEYYLKKFGNDPGTYSKDARAMLEKLSKPSLSKISFVNKSDIPVVIFRVSKIGKEEIAKALQRDESHVLEVSPGEKFLIIDRRTKEEIMKFTATEKSQQVNIPMPPVNGETVTQVTYGSNGKVSGVFKQLDKTHWQEIARGGKVKTFQFKEVSRDKWSVYLFDETRRIKLQLDLYKRIIYYSDATTKKREQYKIIGASKPSPAMFLQAN